jgi:SLOG cluster2
MACGSSVLKTAFLNGRRVALSISNNPDMAVLGLGKEHLDDAMTEIARHLIACGATLAYGGDLRSGGFTELLFEIVDRYRLNRDSDQILVNNYLAWPVHASMSTDQIEKWQVALEGLARLVILAPNGKEILLSDRSLNLTAPNEKQWESGLTAMRMTMASNIAARIALGGQTAKYKGRLPGIAEEALIQIERKAPLYILGGFGGCSYDLTRAIGINRRALPGLPSSGAWPGIEAFRKFGPADLHNGLTPSENRLLAETVHVDQAVALILRGLMMIAQKRRRRPTRNP